MEIKYTDVFVVCPACGGKIGDPEHCPDARRPLNYGPAGDARGDSQYISHPVVVLECPYCAVRLKVKNNC